MSGKPKTKNLVYGGNYDRIAELLFSLDYRREVEGAFLEHGEIGEREKIEQGRKNWCG